MEELSLLHFHPLQDDFQLVEHLKCMEDLEKLVDDRSILVYVKGRTKHLTPSRSLTMTAYTFMGMAIENPENGEFELKSPFQFGFKVEMTRKDGSVKVLRNCTEVHHNFPTDFPHPMGTSVAIESDIHSTGGCYICREYTAISVSKETERAEDHD